MPIDLGARARDFADEMSNLLNKTVCHGIRVSAVVSPAEGKDQPARAVVGYDISEVDLEPSVGIPLTTGTRPATGYLDLSYRLAIDNQGEYLMVSSSFMGYFADAELKEPLMHYDYERDKGDGYPEAHLQVHAHAPGWDAVCERQGWDKPFGKLHLPVGGRRYRPTLEDLIDFLITEGLADGRPKWTTQVENGRKAFQERQLRAAVRQNPEAARAILVDLDTGR